MSRLRHTAHRPIADGNAADHTRPSMYFVLCCVSYQKTTVDSSRWLPSRRTHAFPIFLYLFYIHSPYFPLVFFCYLFEHAWARALPNDLGLARSVSMGGEWPWEEVEEAKRPFNRATTSSTYLHALSYGVGYGGSSNVALFPNEK